MRQRQVALAHALMESVVFTLKGVLVRRLAPASYLDGEVE
jgi:hypothetical protein